MYQWRYNSGREMTQWEANNMPCEYFDGNCKSPYCPRWHDLTRAYFIKEDDGGLGKAEFVEIMDRTPMGWCG